MWDEMRLCRFTGTIEALTSKDKLSIWLVPHVAKEQRIGSCERRAARHKKKKKYIVDVLTGASEAESTTEHSLCFVRWRRVAQTSSASLFLVFTTMTVPKFPPSKKFCWKDQHLLRTHVQIIMCGSSKKKKKNSLRERANWIELVWEPFQWRGNACVPSW